MKKMFIITLLLLSGFLTRAQLIINLQTPPAGVIQKSQLWNILVMNTRQGNFQATIRMTMTNNQTGEQILSATTGAVIFPPGNTMLNATQLVPIQYNILNGNYNIDPGQNGFLPAGNFTVCYNFSLISTDAIAAQQCVVMIVEPLSPPQLILPEDQTEIEINSLPQFSWLPPAPMSLFTNLQYDLSLVQLEPGQTAADALQTNIPILYTQNIIGNSLLYPSSAPTLLIGVQYAWKVIAKNNLSPVSASESWTFTLKQPGADNARLSDLPFTRLQKNGESGYSICYGKLKFAYINETTDTAWNIMVYDISSVNKVPVSLEWDSIPFKSGLNLVEMDLTGNPLLINKHIYLLELHNSRNEQWRMKFEFLKPSNE